MRKRLRWSSFAKKAVAALLCLLLVVLQGFLLPRLLPGDPVLMLTGMEETAMTAQQMEHYRQLLGLDTPLWQQLGGYLGGLLRGDLGYSYHLKAPVTALLAGRMPVTLQLALPALVLASLLAVGLGTLCGSRGGRLDAVVSGGMVLLDAVPSFLLAMCVIYLFAFRLGWLPLGGLGSILRPTGAAAVADRLRHLLLPVLTLAALSLPGKYMLVRSAVAAEQQKPYAAFAAARGLSPWRVRLLHLFPSACRPFVAMLGVNLGMLLSGSVVVESIFSINGMGGLFFQAVSLRDFPTMQGCLLVTAFAVAAATLAADAVLLWLSPKARCGAYES